MGIDQAMGVVVRPVLWFFQSQGIGAAWRRFSGRSHDGDLFPFRQPSEILNSHAPAWPTF